ncbi:MAG: hypothetical protein GX613_16675 [Chloroflexi bacterium]|nr:hypothetical protein [Chloroflexota bacterium]
MAKPVLSSMAPALIRLGFVLLGVIIGLAWTYWGAPIKFYDAEPVHLAEGYKDQWIKMAAVELDESGDMEEARNKIVSAGVSPEMIQALINENQQTDPTLATQLAALLDIAQANTDAAAEQAEKVERSTLQSVLGPLACIGGTLIIGLILAIIFSFYWAPGTSAPRTTAPPAGQPASAPVAPGTPPRITSSTAHVERVSAQRAAVEQKTDFSAAGEKPPVGQYMSTYILGDDLYDESFSIETASGEFLGECGSGISETIGVGDPKRVTATEVWLFDKNDIRTVTKVLMSRHAYNDEALRTKLAPKGEAVLAEPGLVTTLETQTLRIQVRIIDLQYGTGALPEQSFFERITVELAAWPKEGGAPSGPKNDPAFGDTAELLNY